MNKTPGLNRGEHSFGWSSALWGTTVAFLFFGAFFLIGYPTSPAPEFTGLDLPASGTWTSLGRTTSIECMNLGRSPAYLVLTAYSEQGSILGSSLVDIPGFGTSRISLSEAHGFFGLDGQRGSFRIQAREGNLAPPAISCFTLTFREVDGEILFMYSTTLTNAQFGEAFGIYNSINPNPSSDTPLINQLTVFNSGEQPFSALIEELDSAGGFTATHFISLLLPNERTDLELGHPRGEVSGSYRILPLDPAQPYGSVLTRSADDNRYAFSLASGRRTCDSGSLPIAPTDLAQTRTELINISGEDTEVVFEVFSEEGSLRHSEQVTLQPQSVAYLAPDSYLVQGGTGFYRISCQDVYAEDYRLVINNLRYGLTSDDQPDIIWAQASPARNYLRETGSLSPPSLWLPINTANTSDQRLHVIKASSTATLLDIAVFDNQGHEIATDLYATTLNNYLNISVQDQVGPYFTGALVISTHSGDSAVYAELERVLPEVQSGAPASSSSDEGSSSSAPPAPPRSAGSMFVSAFIAHAADGSSDSSQESSVVSSSEESTSSAASDSSTPEQSSSYSSSSTTEQSSSAIPSASPEQSSSQGSSSSAGQQVKACLFDHVDQTSSGTQTAYTCQMTTVDPVAGTPTAREIASCEDLDVGNDCFFRGRCDPDLRACSFEKLNECGLEDCSFDPDTENGPGYCSRNCCVCEHASTHVNVPGKPAWDVCHSLLTKEACDTTYTWRARDGRVYTDCEWIPEAPSSSASSTPESSVSSDSSSSENNSSSSVESSSSEASSSDSSSTAGRCVFQYREYCKRWLRDRLDTCGVIDVNEAGEPIPRIVDPAVSPIAGMGYCPYVDYRYLGHGRDAQSSIMRLNYCYEENPNCHVDGDIGGCNVFEDIEDARLWAIQLSQSVGPGGSFIITANQCTSGGAFSEYWFSYEYSMEQCDEGPDGCDFGSYCWYDNERALCLKLDRSVGYKICCDEKWEEFEGKCCNGRAWSPTNCALPPPSYCTAENECQETEDSAGLRYCESDDECVKRCNSDTETCSLQGVHWKTCETDSECTKHCMAPGLCTIPNAGETPGPRCSSYEDCVLGCGPGGECVFGGGGEDCSDDSNCQATRCHNGECVPGGAGRRCSANSQCTELRCAMDGTCMRGGQGITCSTEGETEGCPEKTCDWGRCVRGVHSRVECSDDSGCQDFGRCDEQGSCIDPENFSDPDIGNLGVGCDEDADCTEKRCRAGLVGEEHEVLCVHGGDSEIPCSDNAACLNKKYCRSGIGSPTTCERGLPSFELIECENAEDCSHFLCMSMGEDTTVGQCIRNPWPGVSAADCAEHGEECALAEDSAPTSSESTSSESSVSSTDSTSSEGSSSSFAELGRLISGRGMFARARLSGPDYAAQVEQLLASQKDAQQEALKLLSSHSEKPSLGQADAPVTIYVFQDLKCGMCKYANREVISKLNDQYIKTGQVRVVFLEFPLGFYAKEVELAQAAKCAADQGRYYDYINHLYKNLKTSSPDLSSSYAQEIGLDASEFERCVSSQRYLETVREEFETGKKLSVKGTPNFFVNGYQVRGAKPLAFFKELISREFAKLSS